MNDLVEEKFSSNTISANAGRNAIWRGFLEMQQTDHILSVLGQYQMHHHITKEDMFAIYEFKKAQILGRIGYLIFKTDSYALENSDSTGNQTILRKLNDFDITVWNGAGDISDGVVNINNKEILNEIPMLYPSDAIIQKKLVKPKKYYLPENENLVDISLEIGYTSYAKTLSQLFISGAVARFPYEDSTGIYKGLHLLFLINNDSLGGLLR